MVKLEHPLSKNMELVATHDLNGQPGFQMALQVMNGHYYLYVTTYYHQGWQILDVTDPKHIICKHLDDPRGKSGTVHPKIQIADGYALVSAAPKAEAWAETLMAFWVTQAGAYVLEHNYPQAVCLMPMEVSA